MLRLAFAGLRRPTRFAGKCGPTWVRTRNGPVMSRGLLPIELWARSTVVPPAGCVAGGRYVGTKETGRVRGVNHEPEASRSDCAGEEAAGKCPRKIELTTC